MIFNAVYLRVSRGGPGGSPSAGARPGAVQVREVARLGRKGHNRVGSWSVPRLGSFAADSADSICVIGYVGAASTGNRPSADNSKKQARAVSRGRAGQAASRAAACCQSVSR